MPQTQTVGIYGTQMLDWHKQAASSKARFKVLVAGRKARKTTFMVNELCLAAINDPRGLVYPYIAPYRQQGKEIVWEDHLAKVLTMCRNVGIPFEINRSELTVQFEGGSKFQVAGADNAEALRGKSNWGGVGLDEYASWKPYIWQEVIRPNLQVHKAWGIIGGTPKGFNHFYDFAKMGDHHNVIDQKRSPTDKDFETFHATSYDNKYNAPEEIESAKRNTTVDFFNQEYLALFTKFTGLVYPEFDLSTHVHPIPHQFAEYGDYLFGLDFAVRGWTASVPILIKEDGEIYILDNYKVDKSTAKEHIPQIKGMLENYAPLIKYTGYADPAGWAKNQQDGEMIWAIADEYLEEDMPITRANNEVVAGINYVRQLLKANKIHIDPRASDLIDELMMYQWKEMNINQTDLRNAPEEVRKVNDHLVDALRYALYSKPPVPDAQKSLLSPGMPIIFPAPRIEEPSTQNPTNDDYTEIDIPSVFDDVVV